MNATVIHAVNKKMTDELGVAVAEIIIRLAV
jgi:hypothetical protein